MRKVSRYYVKSIGYNYLLWRNSNIKTRRRNQPPLYPRPALNTLSHSAYTRKFISLLPTLITLKEEQVRKLHFPQLQLKTILRPELEFSKTPTKLSEDSINYSPSEHSAQMVNNPRLYSQLSNFFNKLENRREENNFLLSQKDHEALKAIKALLVKASKNLGFHKVSGAIYSALGVYHKQKNKIENKWHFTQSSNTDPIFKDFDNPKMRRCAEDSMKIIAEDNELDKLKYLFLMRAPYPEGYGDNNNGVFKFSKLVPCKSCLQHLEKLSADGGNLIIVASRNQGKFLEKSLNQSNIDKSQQKNYLLKDQKKDDLKIIYPEGLQHCFIEIPNNKLPRIIVEKDIGTNVKSQGTQCQNSRKIFTFGEWLEEQEISRQAEELFNVHNFSNVITSSAEQ
jgi:hypothetical protein